MLPPAIYGRIDQECRCGRRRSGHDVCQV